MTDKTWGFMLFYITILGTSTSYAVWPDEQAVIASPWKGKETFSGVVQGKMVTETIDPKSYIDPVETVTSGLEQRQDVDQVPASLAEAGVKYGWSASDQDLLRKLTRLSHLYPYFYTIPPPQLGYRIFHAMEESGIQFRLRCLDHTIGHKDCSLQSKQHPYHEKITQSDINEALMDVQELLTPCEEAIKNIADSPLGENKWTLLSTSFNHFTVEEVFRLIQIAGRLGSVRSAYFYSSWKTGLVYKALKDSSHADKSTVQKLSQGVFQAKGVLLRCLDYNQIPLLYDNFNLYLLLGTDIPDVEQHVISEIEIEKEAKRNKAEQTLKRECSPVVGHAVNSDHHTSDLRPNTENNSATVKTPSCQNTGVSGEETWITQEESDVTLKEKRRKETEDHIKALLGIGNESGEENRNADLSVYSSSHNDSGYFGDGSTKEDNADSKSDFDTVNAKGTVQSGSSEYCLPAHEGKQEIADDGSQSSEKNKKSPDDQHGCETADTNNRPGSPIADSGFPEQVNRRRQMSGEHITAVWLATHSGGGDIALYPEESTLEGYKHQLDTFAVSDLFDEPRHGSGSATMPDNIALDCDMRSTLFLKDRADKGNRVSDESTITETFKKDGQPACTSKSPKQHRTGTESQSALPPPDKRLKARLRKKQSHHRKRVNKSLQGSPEFPGPPDLSRASGCCNSAVTSSTDCVSTQDKSPVMMTVCEDHTESEKPSTREQTSSKQKGTVTISFTMSDEEENGIHSQDEFYDCMVFLIPDQQALERSSEQVSVAPSCASPIVATVIPLVNPEFDDEEEEEDPFLECTCDGHQHPPEDLLENLNDAALSQATELSTLKLDVSEHTVTLRPDNGVTQQRITSKPNPNKKKRNEGKRGTQKKRQKKQAISEEDNEAIVNAQVDFINDSTQKPDLKSKREWACVSMLKSTDPVKAAKYLASKTYAILSVGKCGVCYGTRLFVTPVIKTTDFLTAKIPHIDMTVLSSDAVRIPGKNNWCSGGWLSWQMRAECCIPLPKESR